MILQLFFNLVNYKLGAHAIALTKSKKSYKVTSLNLWNETIRIYSKYLVPSPV